MKIKNLTINTIFFVLIFISGFQFKKYEILGVRETDYIKTMEPLLLSAEGKSEYFHMLPPGTALYKHNDFPEGHSSYIAYINIKGDFASESIHSDRQNLIDPIWAYTISKSQIKEITAELPISKDDLIKILKARKISRDELAQIIREWKD